MSLPLPTPAIHAPFLKEVRTVYQGDYYTADQIRDWYNTADTYAVINEDDQVEYSASWPEACYDHIKEMQDARGLGFVGKWKVRGIKILELKK